VVEHQGIILHLVAILMFQLEENAAVLVMKSALRVMRPVTGSAVKQR